MDDKNKVALVFCLMGAISGAISGSLLKGTPSYGILFMAIVIMYLSSYIVPFVGINIEKYGGRRKVITSGLFSFLLWWLTIWFLIYNID